LPTSDAIPSFAKVAQWPQVSEPYSTSFTLAAGLPIRKPPSGVATTLRAQSAAAGAALRTGAEPAGAAADAASAAATR
jgi:hypothetical protein